MGFGLLLIGYIITYLGSFVAQISAFTNILGVGIIIYSLRKLVFENKLFIASAVFAFFAEIASIISLAIQIFSTNENSMVSIIFAYIAEISIILLNILVMLGIFFLAKAVSLPKIMYMSMLTVGILGLNIVFYILCETVKSQYALERLVIVYMILQVLIVVLSLIVVFNSYVRICYEGDEKMQKQGTGSKFMDTLNNMFDKAFSKDKIDKGNGKRK
ncbi:MAG: hypothetical protein E7602_05335 [Ruminococcaceae bacterium]|nr:hypothetical protein [Oscillospiraceae bacterium]